MKLLLDTHVLFWWLVERHQLSKAGLDALASVESEVYVSTASAWEMAIKVGIGNWNGAALIVDHFEQHIMAERFRILPITLAHVRLAGLMPTPHRDPFDRLLAAQAQIEGLTLVTADARLASLGVPVLW